ncbi:hypothetical protein ACJMK2_007733, partial [Sinanodonta woodiana]
KVSATTTDPSDARHDKDDVSLGKRKRKPKVFPDFYQEFWLPGQKKLNKVQTRKDKLVDKNMDIDKEEETKEEKKNDKCRPKECTGKDQKGKSSPKKKYQKGKSSAEKKYHCSRCNQKFESLQNLLRHQEIHKD